MNKLKVGIPAIAIALSSLAITSCHNKTNNVPKQETKTEAVIQQAPSKDTYKKTNETQEQKLPWWADGLISTVFIGLLGFAYNKYQKFINKLKDDPQGARTYLDICGDNHLDN